MTTGSTYLESIRAALHQMMEADERVVVLGEDILDPYGGAFKATKGLSTRFPGRVFTTPICEGSIAGVAVGLALRGMRPVAEIMFGDFVTLAADQIINHAAKYPAMYNGTATAGLVIRAPMGGGRGYGPTHSQSLEKMFLGTAGLDVIAPSHFHHPGKMLERAVLADRPALFVENKLLYSMALRLEDGPAPLRRAGAGGPDGDDSAIVSNYLPGRKADLTIIAYGGASRLLEPVLVQLAQEEVWVNACLPGRLSSLDLAPALECAQETGRVIVIEESSPDFGWSAEVAARVYDALAGRLEGPVVRLGAARSVIPAGKALEEQVLMSPDKIIAAAFEVMAW